MGKQASFLHVILIGLVAVVTGETVTISGCMENVTLSSRMELSLSKVTGTTCVWNITSIQNTTIVFQLRSIKLIGSGDTVAVLDGKTVNNQILMSYGIQDKAGDVLVSSSNHLLVKINLETAANSRNVTVELNPQVSGGRYHNNGSIQLAKSNPNSSVPVFYQLIASSGLQVQVHLNHSVLFPTTNIILYDGLQPVPANILAIFRSDTQFFPVTGHSEQLLIVAEGFSNQQTFEGAFKSVTPGCDQILSSETGSLQLQRKNIDIACSIVVNPLLLSNSTDNNGATVLDLRSLDLCVNESVVVYEGLTEYDAKIATFPDSTLTLPLIYIKSTKGFRLDFDSVKTECKNDTVGPVALIGSYWTKPDCSQNLSSSEGSLTSPLFPDQYPLNAHCKWTLPIPQNGSTYVYISLQSVSLANNHSISLQDESGHQLWSFSGQKLPDEDAVITINKTNVNRTDTLQTNFVFDSSSSSSGKFADEVSSGFVASYSILGCGGSLTSRNGSISVPKATKKGQKCIWIVQLPKPDLLGSTYIVQFMLSEAYKNSSGVVIRDGGTVQSPVYQLAGNKSKKYLSRTNLLWIQMQAPVTMEINYDTYNCTEKCQNGLCLHPDWKCNGIDDCADMTDERNCTSPSPSPAKGKSGVKVYLAVVIGLMCFAFGVVVTIVIPILYRRLRYPNYRHLQDLMEPSVT